MTIQLNWHGPFFVSPRADGSPSEQAKRLVPENLWSRAGVYVFTAETPIQPWTRRVRYVGKTSRQTFLDRMTQHFRDPPNAAALETDFAATSASCNNFEIRKAQVERLFVTVWLAEADCKISETTIFDSEIEQVERSFIYLMGPEKNTQTRSGPDRLVTVLNSARSKKDISRLGWHPSKLPHAMIVHNRKENAYAECYFSAGNNMLRRQYAVGWGSLWKEKYSNSP